MARAEAVKTAIQSMVRSAPFRPFALNMENGDRIIIEHPENIAFEPGTSLVVDREAVSRSSR